MTDYFLTLLWVISGVIWWENLKLVYRAIKKPEDLAKPKKEGT